MGAMGPCRLGAGPGRSGPGLLMGALGPVMCGLGAEARDQAPGIGVCAPLGYVQPSVGTPGRVGY